MRLEQQLQALEEFGFTLAPGVTIDDMLLVFDRKEYESKPFDVIFFTLGIELESEPWGRRYCRRIWNFDYECIYETGDYVRIVKELSAVAGKSDALRDVSDHVDLDGGTGWLKYSVAEVEQVWDVEIDNDWADPMVIAYVMGDLESDGRRFHGLDNGQATIICYLSDEQAEKLNRLSKGRWKPMVPEEGPKQRGGLMASLRKWFS